MPQLSKKAHKSLKTLYLSMWHFSKQNATHIYQIQHQSPENVDFTGFVAFMVCGIFKFQKCHKKRTDMSPHRFMNIL